MLHMNKFNIYNKYYVNIHHVINIILLIYKQIMFVITQLFYKMLVNLCGKPQSFYVYILYSGMYRRVYMNFLKNSVM